jgi:hypothetical protein
MKVISILKNYLILVLIAQAHSKQVFKITNPKYNFIYDETTNIITFSRGVLRQVIIIIKTDAYDEDTLQVSLNGKSRESIEFSKTNMVSLIGIVGALVQIKKIEEGPVWRWVDTSNPILAKSPAAMASAQVSAVKFEIQMIDESEDHDTYQIAILPYQVVTQIENTVRDVPLSPNVDLTNFRKFISDNFPKESLKGYAISFLDKVVDRTRRRKFK